LKDESRLHPPPRRIPTVEGVDAPVADERGRAATPASIPDWEKQFREVLEEASGGADLPTLSSDEVDSRVARERSIRQWISAARSEASIDSRTRLLFGDGQTKSQQSQLSACRPLSEKSVNREIALYCFLKIQPLNYWPADVIRILGSEMLYQPFVVGALLALGEIAQDPRTHVNRYKPELIRERGLRAVHTHLVPNDNPDEAVLQVGGVRVKPGSEVNLLNLLKNLPEAMVDKMLEDDLEPRGLAEFARNQVLRTFRALVVRTAPLPKSRGRIRTLRSYEQKRDAGVSQKKAVADIAREEGRSEESVRSDIRHARAEIGIRTHPYRTRKPRL
jgi:hypothetical protein